MSSTEQQGPQGQNKVQHDKVAKFFDNHWLTERSCHRNFKEDLEASKELKGGEHTNINLAVSRIHNTRQSSISRFTIEVFKTLTFEAPQCSTDTQLERLMDKWYKPFNVLFFFGAMPWRDHRFSCVNLGRLERWVSGVKKDHPRRVAYYKHENRILILSKSSKYPTTQTEGYQHVCMLLHCILQAFLGRYGCKCFTEHPLCCYLTTWDPRCGGVGKSIHEAAWIEPALTIQKAFQKMVDFPVDLDIPMGVEMEIKRSNWCPDDWLRQRWGYKVMVDPEVELIRNGPWIRRWDRTVRRKLREKKGKDALLREGFRYLGVESELDSGSDSDSDSDTDGDVHDGEYDVDLLSDTDECLLCQECAKNKPHLGGEDAGLDSDTESDLRLDHHKDPFSDSVISLFSQRVESEEDPFSESAEHPLGQEGESD
ncbi:hypothetical protein G7Y89_g13190 [Cudoniella acicularis]|uniref:Uncharacterized protein n=1 Tax=Cudoniella acicularis TaxID=354080 RepID=A0A8H4R908_9HELO|nr:hypothetical protein G7Y89_g13190 [Cudoniella acicularis]